MSVLCLLPGAKSSYPAQRLFLQSLRLRKRCLGGIGDVGDVDTSVTLFGHKYDTPVMIAPTAFHASVNSKGEVGGWRGCSGCGAVVNLISDCHHV